MKGPRTGNGCQTIQGRSVTTLAVSKGREWELSMIMYKPGTTSQYFTVVTLLHNFLTVPWFSQEAPPGNTMVTSPIRLLLLILPLYTKSASCPANGQLSWSCSGKWVCYLCLSLNIKTQHSHAFILRCITLWWESLPAPRVPTAVLTLFPELGAFPSHLVPKTPLMSPTAPHMHMLISWGLSSSLQWGSLFLWLFTSHSLDNQYIWLFKKI